MELYRYIAHSYADESVKVELEKYPVIKETPHGYWIETYNFLHLKKWTSNNSLRRFAYPTPKEAARNFLARKNRQIKLLKYQLNKALEERAIINRIIQDE